MALYAADIEVKLKNKGELSRLEKQFKKLADVSIQLDKTLKSLGKSNVIRVDTGSALRAINQLETKIKGLSRTVSVNASTSGGGRRSEGGLSGAAMPMMAAAMSSRNSQRHQAPKVDTSEIFDTGQGIIKDYIDGLKQSVKQQESIVESANESVIRSQNKYAQSTKNVTRYQEASTKALDKFMGKAKTALQPLAEGFPQEKKALDSLLQFATSYLRTNSKVNEKIGETNKKLVDRASTHKKIKESYEDTLKGTQVELDQRNKALQVADQEQEMTMKKALMTDREIELNKQINQQKVNGFKSLEQQLKHQEKISRELALGKTPAKTLTTQLERSKDATKRAFQEVVRLRQELNKPINTSPKGLIGGMKSLGKMGALGSFGKGALGASAMIPGAAPFAIGAGAGAVGKTGGAMWAGGALGAAGAGLLMGGLALTNFIKDATVASSEMKKMQLALTAVVSSNEDYKNALDSVSEISNSLLIPQAKVTKAFTRLQAAASASGFEVNDVKNMMKGFSAALVATEGDTKNFNGVMLALGQVMGKGKAAAEEIRGQIGERLSVVIPELAESMGKTTKELDKMFDDGKVTVQNIVDLGVHLEKKYGKSAANILKSQMNAGERLKYELSRLSLAVGPLFEDIGAGFQNLGSTIVQALIPAIEKVSELLAVTEKGKKLKLDYLVDKNELLDQDAGIKKIFQKTSIPKQEVMKYLKQTDSAEGAKQMLTNKFGEKATENLGSLDFFKLRQKQERDARVQKIKDQLEPPNITGTKNNKQGGGISKEEQRRLDNFAKFKRNNEIEREFLEDKLELGTKQAELNREIALMVDVHGKENKEAIEEEFRLRDELKERLENEVVTRGKINDMIEESDKKLRDLSNPLNQLKNITEAFEDSFSNAIQEVVRGTKSIGDAVSSMLSRIADAMLQNAADVLAAQASNSLFKLLGNAIAGGFGNSLSNTTSLPTDVGGLTMKQAIDLPAIKYASGGYVDRPTNAILAEGGEGEYVIPESKLASSLSRYQAGHRGSSVVPGGVGNSGGSGGGSGEVTVNYTGPTLEFNGDEYVPRSAVPQIIYSASMAGASAGRANTMKDLKNSRSQRARLGL